MVEEGVGLDLLVENEEPPGPPEEESWEDFRRQFTQPDHVIDFHGHIIGLALSHDERYVFVNVRPWPDEAIISDPREPPPIAQQIEVHVIDLETLSRNDEVYRGHRGFTANDQCFFMFMDASARFVASGSEDSCGYIWDRHHRCLLGKLQHSSVVSAVAFNPIDPEMAVSVSDDNTVKVWRSKRVLLEASKELD